MWKKNFFFVEFLKRKRGIFLIDFVAFSEKERASYQLIYYILIISLRDSKEFFEVKLKAKENCFLNLFLKNVFLFSFKTKNFFDKFFFFNKKFTKVNIFSLDLFSYFYDCLRGDILIGFLA